jgi:hypothetical protein
VTDLREKARGLAVRTGTNPAAFVYEFHRDGFAREAMVVALEWAAEQVTAHRLHGWYQNDTSGRVSVLLEHDPAAWLTAEAARLRKP